MSYLALYRKWRPWRFEDIVGQDVVVRVLVNALRTQRVSHAYLFCGPRGVGKTTTARVLAQALNCEKGVTPEPCGTCPSCVAIQKGRSLDVIEIDAASHRGIDEIRELRENVKYAPFESRFKVYIIDEVHMLTQEAFNALLKTLEEPPEHVVFILATTDPRRLPETVLSRCVKLIFNPIPHEAIVAQLQKISSLEGFAVAEEVLHLVARKAGGSLRDAESLLEQLFALGEREISLSMAAKVLRDIEPRDLDAFFTTLREGNLEKTLITLEEWLSRGLGPEDISGSLAAYFRDLLVVLSVGEYNPLFGIPKSRWSVLRDLACGLTPSTLRQVLERLRVLEGDLRRLPYSRVLLEVALLDIIEYLGQKKESVPVPPPPQPEVDFWQEVLREIKRSKISLYAFLQLAEVRFEEPSRLVVAFGPDCRFHKESVERRENLEILEKAILRVRGKRCRIECVLKDGAAQAAVAPPVPEKNEKPTRSQVAERSTALPEILNLFEGTVVHYVPIEQPEQPKGRWEDAELEKSDERSPEDAG
ncbi:MAG: DNA polymerase III subunit gamma/tau [Candidatus Caldatribacterium sp.]|nr:DNA polymerase III subunit gamma/tau [Candidatus Caldatribacterium sp.]